MATTVSAGFQIGARSLAEAMFASGGARGSTLEQALAYRAYGFGVLPLRGKQPATDLIFHTQGTSSTGQLAERGASEGAVRFWFTDPSVNVGIFCGEPSQGLVVLDFDCGFPPADAHLPLTPTVKTSRGLHFYYRGGGADSNQNYRWGEVRAQAPQYVVAAPSLHPESREPYRWLLPLDALELAEYAHVRLPDESTRGSKRNGLLPKKNNHDIRPSWDARPSRDRGVGDRRPDRWLNGYDRDPRAVAAMARALGIHASLGSSFHCVIHDDKTPSAALYQAPETGEWLYHDLHAPARGAQEWLNLAQVRAIIAGRRLPVSATELATWKLILLVEAGLLELVPVPATPPASTLSPDARHLYERFLFLLGCRWNYTLGAPAPYTRQFASALGGLSVARSRAAIDELKQHEQIYVVGEHGRIRLWLPAGIELAPEHSA